MDVEAAEELKGFGLSSYEASAYALLLRLGSADASLVAQKASIPFGRVYDVLNSLVDRGLLTLHEGRPKQYRAVQPRVAMSLLLAQRKRELDDRYAELTRLASDLEKRLSPKVKYKNLRLGLPNLLGWGKFGTGCGGSDITRG